MKILKAFVKVLLGLFMVFAGFNHLTVAREEFVAQVPVWIQFSPGFTDFVVLASGVIEILLGLAMLILWKERSGWAGVALAIFYVLIFTQKCLSLRVIPNKYESPRNRRNRSSRERPASDASFR